MTHQIAQSLERRGISLVCHFTPCDRLPGIFQHGAILSWEGRKKRGISEPQKEHYWGTPGKKEALSGYVICSFMPPWGMMSKHDEEMAIIILHAGSICCEEGVAFCPGNSALNEYPSEEIETWEGPDRFDACFPNSESYQAGTSEIFVPGQVPLKHFREIAFCDTEARDYWGAIIRETDVEVEMPPGPLKLWNGSVPRFRFPGSWQPSRRVRT